MVNAGLRSEELANLFALLDADGDGSITTEELVNGIIKLDESHKDQHYKDVKAAKVSRVVYFTTVLVVGSWLCGDDDHEDPRRGRITRQVDIPSDFQTLSMEQGA